MQEPGTVSRLSGFCAFSLASKLQGIFASKTDIFQKQRFKGIISSGVDTGSHAEFFRIFVMGFLRRRMNEGDLPSPFSGPRIKEGGFRQWKRIPPGWIRRVSPKRVYSGTYRAPTALMRGRPGEFRAKEGQLRTRVSGAAFYRGFEAIRARYAAISIH
jgi:hypothetical protein